MKKADSLHDKAEKAMKKAVLGVIEQHKRDGRPLAIWEDEKVKYISANEALKSYKNKDI